MQESSQRVRDHSCGMLGVQPMIIGIALSVWWLGVLVIANASRKQDKK